jgi:hypothetical protein
MTIGRPQMYQNVKGYEEGGAAGGIVDLNDWSVSGSSSYRQRAFGDA